MSTTEAPVPEKVTILLVEDNKDFAKLLGVYLERYDRGRFAIVWKENAAEALAEIDSNQSIDVVVMDYFLPGKNGLELTKDLVERKVDLPIVFLTVNKDFDIVLKVMKLGVSDYLVKEEISSPLLPKTILGVIERHRLQEKLMQIEISQHRLKVIRDMMSAVLGDLERPLKEMQEISAELGGASSDQSRSNYLRIIEDNVNRIREKLEKLKQLKEDKTVQYIKDIKMLDLS